MSYSKRPFVVTLHGVNTPNGMNPCGRVKITSVPGKPRGKMWLAPNRRWMLAGPRAGRLSGQPAASAGYIFFAPPSGVFTPSGGRWPTRWSGLIIAAFLALAGLAQAQVFQLTQISAVPSSAIAAGSGLVTVKWKGGTGPFLIQSRNGLSGSWQDGSGIVSGSNQTNIMTSSMSFYRVQDLSSVKTSSDTTPPSVPTGLTATAVSSSQINVSWNASTDSAPKRVTPSGVKGYNIYRGGFFLKQLLAPSTSTSDINLMPATTYNYTVTAVDNAYNESAQSAPVSVTTPAAHTAPTANAGLSQSGSVGSAVTFNGSGTAYGATIVSYNWTFGDGASASGQSVSHAYTSAGTYTVTLTATDNLGASGSATTTATITNSVHAPPTANAGSSQSGSVNGAVTFSGSGTAYNGATITSYGWTFGDGTSASGQSVSHTYTNAGSYTVTLTVIDSLGASGSASTTATITHTAPTANAGPSQSARAGGAVTFSGSGTAYNGATISSYFWLYGDGTSASGATVSHTYAGAGTYTATLTVTDNLGASGSATTTATITNVVSNPPLSISLTSPVSGSTVSNAVTLAASASTNAVKVVYYCDGYTVATNTVPPFTSSWNTTTTANGSHNLYATAYDASNHSTNSATISVTVNNSTAGTPGALNWVNAITSSYNLIGNGTAGNSIKSDAGGNVIVAGNFANDVNFGGGHSFNLGSGITGIFVAKYSPSGSIQWVNAFPGQSAKSVAVDSQNNIIVAGTFAGTVNFGGTTLTANNLSSMFIAKYTPSGSLLWVKGFGGNALKYDSGLSVAVDSGDNIVMLGQLESANVNFGSGITLSPPGSSSLVLVKLSSSGTTQWAEAYGSYVAPQSLALDSSGNIVVTGQVEGSTDFGGGAITSPNPGTFSSFVVKYSSSGAYQWAKVFGGSSSDSGYGIAADPRTGNIIVTGGFSGTANFGGGNVSVAAGAVYLAGYDPSGNFLWEQSSGGTAGSSLGTAVQIDANGNMVLIGFKGCPWYVGGAWNNSGGYFVQAFTISGNTAPVLKWYKFPGASTTGSSQGNGVAFDSSGHVLITGWLDYGTVDFGGISVTTTANGQYGFVTEYTK